MACDMLRARGCSRPLASRSLPSLQLRWRVASGAAPRHRRWTRMTRASTPSEKGVRELRNHDGLHARVTARCRFRRVDAPHRAGETKALPRLRGGRRLEQSLGFPPLRSVIIIGPATAFLEAPNTPQASARATGRRKRRDASAVEHAERAIDPAMDGHRNRPFNRSTRSFRRDMMNSVRR